MPVPACACGTNGDAPMMVVMASATSSGLFMTSMRAASCSVSVAEESPQRRDRVVVKFNVNSVGTESRRNSAEIFDHVQSRFRQVERVEVQRRRTAFDETSAQARDEVCGERADAVDIIAIRGHALADPARDFCAAGFGEATQLGEVR